MSLACVTRAGNGNDQCVRFTVVSFKKISFIWGNVLVNSTGSTANSDIFVAASCHSSFWFGRSNYCNIQMIATDADDIVFSDVTIGIIDSSQVRRVSLFRLSAITCSHVCWLVHGIGFNFCLVVAFFYFFCLYVSSKSSQ